MGVLSAMARRGRIGVDRLGGLRVLGLWIGVDHVLAAAQDVITLAPASPNGPCRTGGVVVCIRARVLRLRTVGFRESERSVAREDGRSDGRVRLD